MAWAFKKIRSLWNGGRRSLVIAAVVVVCLLLLLGFADAGLAAPAKIDLNKLKSLGASLVRLFETYVGDKKVLPSFEPYVLREHVLVGSFFLAAAAVFGAIVQGTKAVARNLIEICAQTYRGFTNALLRVYFGRAIGRNVNLLAVLFLLLLLRYLRNGIDSDARRMLIETQASEVEESRAG
jgi:hypothetical protein